MKTLIRTLIKTVNISITTLCIAIGLNCMAATVVAETIQVPIGQQGQHNQNLNRPRTGTTKTSVEQKFGAPIEVRAAVGSPPISSWVYAEFIVYFEHEHVVHTVLKASSQN